MTSTMGSTYTPDVQRYIIQASDVLSEHRLTVSPLADPSTAIWYTERYISHPTSGPAEIIEHIVHQPTNTICWSIHRPTNIRRQGWYIRLRSPLFPPGVSIPLGPVSATSPYYVDGALAFKCQTNDVSKPRPPAISTRTDSISSTASSSSSTHSYPPTPVSSPPPSVRRDLPPLRLPSSKGRSLTGEGEDVYIIGTDGDEQDDNKTPTVAVTRIPDVLVNGSSIPEEPKRPPSSSNGKGKQLPLQNVSTNQPTGHARRPPPPRLAKINEFILVPLSEATNGSSGPFVNLSPTPASAAPSSPSSPHSHHRTSSASYSSTTFPSNIQYSSPDRQSGIFTKAVSLLKSSLPTTLANSLNSTMHGNSFTITRVPDLVGIATSMNGVRPNVGDVKNKEGMVVSPPPPYTSTANLLGGSSNTSLPGPSASWTSTQYIPVPHSTATSISSTSFVQPLPPPLLSFTDQTSLFPISFGFGGLFKGSGSGPSHTPHSRVSLQVTPRDAPTHTSSPSLPISSPSSSSASSRHSAPPNSGYTTLGTLTVSTAQLAELGVDTAFWVTCALVFWGYLEEREGYLSAVDD